MQTDRLFFTSLPVLLGSPRETGRAARTAYLRHRVSCAVFGPRKSLLLLTYAVSAGPDLARLSDGMRVQALRDFALLPVNRRALLSLVPCSAEAEAFMSAHADELEPLYVLLPRPAAPDGDPLAPLVRSGGLTPF